jgi:hypothetical protein
MDTIQGFLGSLKHGGRQNHLNLTMIPLLMPDGGEPDYLILEEALSQGLLFITEISTGGSVPDLKLINKSADRVLVVEGEELIGAKQNRIVNASFLIDGNTEFVIPVSCVEQGRWTYRSQKFASGEKVMPSILRREHQKKVAESLNRGGGFRSDQGMIWNEISEKSARMNVHSSTGAMADLFEGQKNHLAEYLKAFHLVDCQVGALFAINGKVAGLDCFGHWQAFSKFFKKLVQSYALDALDWLEEGKGGGDIPAAEIRRFLEGIQRAPRKLFPSIGLGENIRLEGPFISGAALTYNETVLHLSAFGHDGKKDEGSVVPFRRFSQRRSKI